MLGVFPVQRFEGVCQRGDDPTFFEFCQRLLEVAIDPMKLEPKKEFKTRTGGKSPDRADTTALLILWAKYRYGLIPGAEHSTLIRSNSRAEKVKVSS